MDQNDVVEILPQYDRSVVAAKPGQLDSADALFRFNATWAVLGYFVAIAYKGYCLVCSRHNFQIVTIWRRASF
jgi:hypothetical protein